MFMHFPSFALVLLLLCSKTNADECSDVIDLNKCETTSPYCNRYLILGFIVYAG